MGLISEKSTGERERIKNTLLKHSVKPAFPGHRRGQNMCDYNCLLIQAPCHLLVFKKNPLLTGNINKHIIKSSSQSVAVCHLHNKFYHQFLVSL